MQKYTIFPYITAFGGMFFWGEGRWQQATSNKQQATSNRQENHEKK
ncbi:MAG: hypothetical protein LBL13_06230 [Bacteroidales bacterium]|nr:hypothetical protein [Bacteroidales bacterium]